jgi:hypothetical protein
VEFLDCPGDRKFHLTDPIPQTLDLVYFVPFVTSSFPSTHLVYRVKYPLTHSLAGLGLLWGSSITLRHITLGRTPLDEWSAARRDLYLTTHNTLKIQTSTPSPGGIRTHKPRKQAAADPRLRPRGASPACPHAFHGAHRYNLAFIFCWSLGNNSAVKSSLFKDVTQG